MTEQEWLECTDPTELLRFVRGNASDRKLRLFVCACGRRSRPLLDDELCRTTVEVAERYADGRATQEELAAKCTALDADLKEEPRRTGLVPPLLYAEAIVYAASQDKVVGSPCDYEFGMTMVAGMAADGAWEPYRSDHPE